MVDKSQLLVLTSILYGLAIARYFDQNSKYFYNKEKIILEWLIPGWSILAFLFMVRTWWEYAKSGLTTQITFWEYLDILSVAILLYIQATLLTPEIPKEGILNLKKHYIKISPLFFGSILFIFIKYQVIRFVENYNDFISTINYIRLIFIACLIFMTIFKNRVFHVVMFFISAFLYFTFILMTD